MNTKSWTRKSFICILAFVIFTAVNLLSLLLGYSSANSAYFVSLAVLSAAGMFIDPLWASLLGLGCGTSVFIISLLGDSALASTVAASFPHTVSSLGLAFFFLSSVLPTVLICLSSSACALLFGKIKKLNAAAISPISGLIAASVSFWALYGLCALFIFYEISGPMLTRFSIMMQRKYLLLLLVVFALHLLIGVMALIHLSRRRAAVADAPDDSVADLDPGAELAPFKRIPTPTLLSEEYFDYEDYVLDLEHVKPFSNVKLVIFDMDGLIFDSERACCACLKRAAREFGFEVTDIDYRDMIGGSWPEFNRTIGRLAPNVDPREVSNLEHKYFREMSEKNLVAMKKGFVELADHLESREIKMALGTSTPSTSAQQSLARAGILSLFSTIVYGDMVEHAKPSPDIYLKVLELEHVAAADALVLEDSKNGILAACAAGIRVAMVPDLIPPTGDLTAKCAAVCDDLSQIINLI